MYICNIYIHIYMYTSIPKYIYIYIYIIIIINLDTKLELIGFPYVSMTNEIILYFSLVESLM